MWLSGKESACLCSRCGFDPWVGKIPWRRIWQPTPEFLPKKAHGQRSLVGYNPCGHKQLDTTEELSTAQAFTAKQFQLAHLITLGNGYP